MFGACAPPARPPGSGSKTMKAQYERRGECQWHERQVTNPAGRDNWLNVLGAFPPPPPMVGQSVLGGPRLGAATPSASVDIHVYIFLPLPRRSPGAPPGPGVGVGGTDSVSLCRDFETAPGFTISQFTAPNFHGSSRTAPSNCHFSTNSFVLYQIQMLLNHSFLDQLWMHKFVIDVKSI